jgi:ABC-type phosphate transport system substrate-binding protein
MPAASQNIDMRRVRTLTVLLVALILPCLLHAKQLAVVTDTGNETNNLTAAELINLFTTHTHSWSDGKPVLVVVRDPSSSDMDLVLRKVFNMSAAQAKAFLQAHHATVVVADSDDAVLRFVSSNRGAIGIVDLYSLTKDVKVIKVDGKLPVEQGYLLRGN